MVSCDGINEIVGTRRPFAVIHDARVDLPFADDPNAFMLTAIIMIVVALVMLLIFRLRHWL